MNSGCSALTGTGSQVSGWPASTSCIHRSRPSVHWILPPVRRYTITLLTASQPPMAMASSTAGERDDLAAAHLLVGRDDDRGADVADALLQALGREAAEHHGVRHAQARAGLHGDHRLDRHGHVDDGAVTLLVAQLGQAIGEAAHAGQQFAVGDAVDLAVVGFEDDRGLVGVAIGQVHVQTVGRDIQLAVAEPAVERGVGLIQHLGEGLGPLQVGAGLAGPESVKVVLDLGAQFLVGVHARDRGALRSALGRRKDRVSTRTDSMAFDMIFVSNR